MALTTYFKKSVSLKKQFFIFCLSSIILSFVLSMIFISITGEIVSPLRSVVSIQNFVETNKYNVLNKNFKSEIDIRFKSDIGNRSFENKANYWIVLKDKSILYSFSDETLEESIEIQSMAYSKKTLDKSTGESYRIFLKPLIFNGELKGALVLKCNNSFIFSISGMYNLIEKSSSDSIINFFILVPVILVPPIIIILVLSLLFSKSINDPLEKIILWSEKIKNNDLNFKVDISYNNELGKVMEAFEDMRFALENSLKTQWIMTEQRKEMILSLTHDIKTPITVICGHLELITGNYSNINDETKEKSLNIIMSNANRVKRLINELNEVWDLEKPDFLLNRQKINLLEFLDEINDNFSYLCSEKNITLSISHSFNEEDYFSFDAFRIEEILENLISNSLRFTVEGGSITVKCFKENQDLIFKVSDSGKGFSEKHIDNIFKRFYKGKSTENENNNCGLGLYICKLIIDKHNGCIKGYNSINGGATVKFVIK